MYTKTISFIEAAPLITTHGTIAVYEEKKYKLSIPRMHYIQTEEERKSALNLTCIQTLIEVTRATMGIPGITLPNRGLAERFFASLPIVPDEIKYSFMPVITNPRRPMELVPFDKFVANPGKYEYDHQYITPEKSGVYKGVINYQTDRVFIGLAWKK